MTPPVGDQVYRVPVAGGVVAMRVCRPAGAARARAVVVEQEAPAACAGEVAQWFVRRGYVAALPVAREVDAGPCASPNYVQAGLAGAADVSAAVAFVTGLGFVQPDRAVVIGEGSGGWATVAYGSLPHAPVSALVAVGPGLGGHARGVAGQTCRADLLAYSAAYFATTDRTPMVWVFARNDGNVGPASAKAMAQSYQSAGGALQFEPVGGFDGDGRLLSGAGGSAVWGPIVEGYLAGVP